MSEVFNHLHVHTEYSLVDGAIRIDDLIKKVQQLGHQAVAITDHANLFGAIEFYAKAAAKGIKPIIGAELYVESLHGDRPCYQYVFLAKSLEGYHNLVHLVSRAYLDADQGALPIVKRSRLADYAAGLFCIASFHGGELSAQHEEAFAAVIANAVGIYGRDSFFAEICFNQFPGEQEKIAQLVARCRQAEIAIVAGANAHYLEAEDQDAHTVLVAIKNELKLSQLRDRRKNVTAHLLNNEEMQRAFADYPEALANTLRIASQCAIKFEFGKYFLPKIDLGQQESTADAMARLAHEGLEQRFQTLSVVYGPSFDDNKKSEYRKRLDYEIKVITDMGFPDYFLIVQDFINWAKRHDIPVGPGRGSGAGSLVAYALRITDLDPIPYNLIFERFLNPERVSMPDFDVDFCQDRRDEVIRYVSERYGAEQVAQITTFGKMLAKAALRDVGRVYDVSYGKIDRIAKLIPNELGIKLSDAIAREPRIREEAAKDPLLSDVLRTALKLEGLSRHTSVHAAGIVISDGPMENYVPVYRSEDGSLITQYEMKNAEKVGLVKFDFLGLKTLTVIKRAIDMIATTRQLKIDIDKIPLDDRKVYQLISEAKSIGVFQLESSGMQQLLLKLKPSNFEDIIALVALFRPGPLQSGMVDDFVERKHGRQAIEYLVPMLEPILRDTYGTILYQEQVQKIAAVLASYTLGEADLLRRAMGKKKPEEMAKQKSRFVDGCKANQIAEETASTLFDLMAKFAEYGFNKSHSAAYGLVSYQTGYLKANFTAEFFAASMTCDMDNTDKIIAYAKDCRQFGIHILQPDINSSELDFTVPAPQNIRFGLAAIKGIGRASVEALVAERAAGGSYANLTQLAKRINLNKMGKKTLELLIHAGALDLFGISRAILTSKIDEVVKYSLNHHDAADRGQRGLFADVANDGDESDQFANLKSLEVQDEAIVKGDPAHWLKREKSLLGVYLSGHPLKFFSREREHFCNARLAELPKFAGQSELYALCMLYDFFERTTKDGKKLLVIRLEDDSGDLSPQVPIDDFLASMPPVDTPVIAKFRVNRGFEDKPPRPRLEKLWSLDEFMRQRLKQLGLVLSSPDTHTVARVKDILQSYPGTVPLDLKLRLDQARIGFKLKPLQVDPCVKLLSHLRQVAAVDLQFRA